MPDTKKILINIQRFNDGEEEEEDDNKKFKLYLELWILNLVDIQKVNHYEALL